MAETTKTTLPKEIFDVEVTNHQLLKVAYTAYLANARSAAAKTKKRGEVSGGGKKPWKQKGTGRARAGSSRSPLWVGGGKIFGPDGNQNYTVYQNKKAHALALKTVLSQKAVKGLIVVEDLKLKSISTKTFVKDLAAIKAEGKTLVIVPSKNDNLVKSATNVESVTLRAVDNISVYDVLNASNIVITKEDIKTLEGGLK